MFKYGKKAGYMGIALLVLAVLPLVVAACVLPNIGPEVATKFNAAGEATRWGKSYELLARKDYGNEMFRYARQFAAADTIVVAAPLWDLSFPSQLKVYIENIYVTGVVTRYDESGQPVGLCRGEKLYYVSTSGGPFDGRYGYEYLKSIATECFGIPSVQLVTAEGLDIWGNDPEAILQRAIEGLADGK